MISAGRRAPPPTRADRPGSAERRHLRSLAEGHGHGIRTIIDIVPNLSDQHRWFRAALPAEPGSAERARFWFRPGRGADGEFPANNWRSIIRGPARSGSTAPRGMPGGWYLDRFVPQHPGF